LLTGAPLHNTIEALQALLKFLHPGQFGDITTANDIMFLRKKLKRHLLRRLKADVDWTIAPKEETIIECMMTKAQKQLYRAVLEMNARFLSHGTNLANIALELRQVCLHPYLIKDAEDRILADRGPNSSTAEQLDSLIRASGKMILLDKLLPKLKIDGHRVLIFSQMTDLLDILQDYLAAVGHKFLRIEAESKGARASHDRPVQCRRL
jgi:SNF2 family DNA or RNA helicase